MKTFIKKSLLALSIPLLSSIQAMRLPEIAQLSSRSTVKQSAIGNFELSLPHLEPIALTQDALDVMLLEEVKKGDTSKVSELLKKQANPNYVTEHGSNILIKSVQFKSSVHTEIVKILLKNKALVSPKNKQGMNALMIACKEGESKKALLLLDSCTKEDIDATNNEGETALMLAAWHGDPYLISELILSGASIKKTNKYDETALIYFLENPRAHIDGLTTLLKYKASTDVCDRYNNTALSLAIQNHKPLVTKTIIKHQAPLAVRSIDVLLKNRDGFNVLEEASFRDAKESSSKEEQEDCHLLLVKFFLKLDEREKQLRID